MALVWASQDFVVEAYEYVTRKKWFSNRTKSIKRQIKGLRGVEIICDESEVSNIIEEKIKEILEKEKRKYNYSEISYRKYCKANEFDYRNGIDYSNEKEFKLEVEYIRDWKMEKIMKELDGNQFAILCKELGISAVEAIARS